MEQIEPIEPTPHTPEPPKPSPNVQPKEPDTEVNPGKVGNETEVDLDRTKTETYPNRPPEKQ